MARANQEGLRILLKDVGFVLDAVDEIDPWLEHTRSPAAVARAYRDFVLAKCNHAGVKLTDDELQLVQVWFGASQWAPGGQSSLTGGSPLGASPALASESQQRGQPRERSYLVESALPPPDQRADIPLPADFDFDSELELQQQQNQKSAGQRFRFKH